MLARIKMPLLETLYIHYNRKIVSMQPFRKLNLKHLKYLSMRREFIMQKEMQ